MPKLVRGEGTNAGPLADTPDHCSVLYAEADGASILAGRGENNLGGVSVARRTVSRAAIIAALTMTSLFVFVSVGAASASANVPCSAAALVAAVNSANGSGGGTINLAPRCDYALTTADNGENGLPVVTSRIAVNGNGATIDGTSSVRVFEVDGPGGSLSLQNVTITGGSADIGGGSRTSVARSR